MMACKPVPVKISQEEWRAMYEDQVGAFYAYIVEGEGENKQGVDVPLVEIDHSLQSARPSEMIRDLCRKSHEDWRDMRYGNFRAAVSAIRVDNWPGVDVSHWQEAKK